LFPQISTRNQPLIGYSWDADTRLTRWWQATEIAELNGRKLAAFVRDYREAAPGTRLRFVAHSLGGRVVLSALQRHIDEGGARIASVSLLGAAAHDQEVALDGRCGDAIEGGTVRLDNYYAADDRILTYASSIAEFDEAVGRGGAEEPTPKNYTDHEVTDDVLTHLGYFLPDVGCMGDVVGRFDTSSNGVGSLDR
jgi:pimeloyl-ACP methyl ester carboxylesterase